MNSRLIVLTGFMGSGKTTVGRIVADLLGWAFIDADEQIEVRVGMTIREIFERYGENGFRLFERIVCQSLAARERAVIATGGGMLVDEANRALMIASGFVVCLDVTPTDIFMRLSAQDGAHQRPLFSGNWQALYQQRQPAYAAVPYHVDTSGKAPEVIAEEIVTLWQRELK